MRYLLLLSLIAFVGCGKKSDPTVAGGPKGGPPMGGMPGAGASIVDKLPGGPEFAAGKKLYSDNNCVRCHKLGDTGGPPPGMAGGGMKGPGGMSGPDLTKTGADANHTVAWLAAHIRDPKSHSPQSRMPATGTDRISDADLTVLAEYLASQK